ncbi:hypothetical protein [Amycolatopsis coloradensis]|uniref:hypothetical protein n=1 Tax=Amycolatopsis coloradensis TaxID=76021 RepID=UPI00142E00C6|nr:hypothetical protein [Amycolatopsis coloradensis]
MGFDWEAILGTSGASLNDAYETAVSAVMYPDQSGVESAQPFPVGDEHDDTMA